jgi:hypothetical protein
VGCAVLGEIHLSYTGNLHKKENEEVICGKTTDGTKVSVKL